MTRQSFNPDIYSTDVSQYQLIANISPADWRNLSDSQRDILDWMSSHKRDVRLAEIITLIGTTETEIIALLEPLVQQGLIIESLLTGELRYKIGGEDTRLVDNEHKGKPLAIIFNPSGDYAVTAGSGFDISITVNNQGDENALIDVYIDDTSQKIREWATNYYDRLALGTKQSSEVIFKIQVPPETLSGTYNYAIIIDAPVHYPEDTPIKHQARIQVLPSVWDTIRVNDPTFNIQPLTNPQSPTIIQPGGMLQFTAIVHNRSDRVDRFRLTCEDLDNNWFTIRYPENIATPGIVTNDGGLDLNPGAKGQIILVMHPPMEVWAGNYFPTLRLTSANNPDLILLDTIYLKIPPLYLVTAEFRTIVSKVKKMPGLYEIKVNNSGNTIREIALSAQSSDEEEFCTYTLNPSSISLLPQSSQIVSLQVQPNNKKRAFTVRILSFLVQLEDTKKLPLPPDRLQGTLIWEARPWWQFWLIFLAVLGSIGLLVFAIWWTFFKPQEPAKVVEFQSHDNLYQEADGEFIALNWKVNNPSVIDTIKITGQSGDGNATVQPRIYNFNKGIPDDLKPYCGIKNILICQKVKTDARQPGEYTFEITVTPKKNTGLAAETAKTNVIKIIAFSQPKVIEFASVKPVYQESKINTSTIPISENKPGENTAPVSPNSPNNLLNTSTETTDKSGGSASLTDQGEPILLNWKIINPEQLKEVRIIGRAPDGSVKNPVKVYDFNQGIPTELEKLCTSKEILTCERVPTDARKAGDYIFEITTFSKKGKGVVLESAKTDTIKILGMPAPKIIELASVKPLYDAGQNDTIALNWKIINPEQIKELRLIGQTADAAVTSELKRFDFSQGVPEILKSLCQITGEQLTCQGIRTEVKAPGDYIFELALISKQGQGEIAESKKTNNIKIVALPFKLTEFTVNGKDALPKYIFPIAKDKKVSTITLSWKIEGSKDLKVELLPSPGSVPLSGVTTYPISEKPGSETITLQIKNSTGQQINRSIIIETFDPTPPPAPVVNITQPPPAAMPTAPPSTPTASPSVNNAPVAVPAPPPVGSPVPSDPDKVSPAELPPRPD